jgi:hypothetical protein
MIIEITEEEREFLQRICTRAELFCRMNISSPNKSFSDFEKDLHAIERLIVKLKEKNDNQ